MQRHGKVRLFVGMLALLGALFGSDARGSEPDRPRAEEIATVDGLLVADGRVMQLFTGSPNGARRWAKVVNEYADILQGKVALYAMVVPTAQTFYLPENYDGRIPEEPPNIDATYKLLDAAVETVDVVDALRGHESENIYFRTDHHWTALAAYYAYREFCQAAGLKPISLDPANKRTISPYRGSLYRYVKESKHRQADTIDYWLPNVSVSVERFNAEGKNSSTGTLLKESSKGYGVFLGGDAPLMVAHSSSSSGRRALLIKNSYGNPFAVYLVEHFETVAIVDYRKYEGSVLDLIDEHGITDLIILNGTITANAKSHVEHLGRLLEGGAASEASDDTAAPPGDADE